MEYPCKYPEAVTTILYEKGAGKKTSYDFVNKKLAECLY